MLKKKEKNKGQNDKTLNAKFKEKRYIKAKCC